MFTTTDLNYAKQIARKNKGKVKIIDIGGGIYALLAKDDLSQGTVLNR